MYNVLIIFKIPIKIILYLIFSSTYLYDNFKRCNVDCCCFLYQISNSSNTGEFVSKKCSFSITVT